MKKINFLCIIAASLLLFSCSSQNPTSSQTSSSSSSETSTSQPRPTGKVDINFSCINDFHGAINELTDFNPQPGLAKVAAFMKEKKANGNILINSGDMWQGTFESNYNHGELVTRVFKDIGFDANTIGNHEFDWKVDAIKSNEAIYGDNFLCANIAKYNASGYPSYIGDRYELGKDYTIVENNGVRVGIIGVIGKDQFSSIDSQNTQDFLFLDPTDVVKNISNELKNNLNCQVVVASYHAGQGVVDREILSFNSNGQRYVDAVFCAHTHQDEYYVEQTTYNGVTTKVPFIQSGCNGWYCGNVTLTYDWDNNISTLNNELTTWNESITHSSITPDAKTQSLINEYNAISQEAGSKVLGSSTGYINRYAAARMTAKGMYDLCQKNSQTDVVLAMTNVARNNINSTTITMADAITCLPFDNQIVVCEVSAKDLANEIGYNYIYNPTHITIDSSSGLTYKVALCSYLAYHQSIYSDYHKVYNYFPSIKNIYELKDSSGNLLYYRDGLLEQFKDSSGRYGKTINPDDYIGADYEA